jgi:hypothetical protein
LIRSTTVVKSSAAPDKDNSRLLSGLLDSSIFLSGFLCFCFYFQPLVYLVHVSTTAVLIAASRNEHTTSSWTRLIREGEKLSNSMNRCRGICIIPTLAFQSGFGPMDFSFVTRCRVLLRDSFFWTTGTEFCFHSCHHSISLVL